MTPSASLTFVLQVLDEVNITNTVVFDPLLNWLRAVSCKEKGKQHITTDTPTTTYWLPSFSNEEETRWAYVRMNSIFSTIKLKTISTSLDRSHRTQATITDNDRQAKMISQDVAAMLMTMGIASSNSRANKTTSVSFSFTNDKLMGKTGLYDGIPGRIPSIWKELKLETTRNDRIDRLIREFPPEETGNDSVDITVSDRLGTCIVTEKYGIGLGFRYKNCNHGLTICATSPQTADEVAM